MTEETPRREAALLVARAEARALKAARRYVLRLAKWHGWPRIENHMDVPVAGPGKQAWRKFAAHALLHHLGLAEFQLRRLEPDPLDETDRR